jgi:hypothetical protein
MCTVCDPYADSLPVASLRELDEVAQMVSRGERAGDLDWLDGDAVVHGLDPFALAQAAAAAPRSALNGRWLCSACSRLFLLELNSRAVTGDLWRPLYGN